MTYYCQVEWQTRAEQIKRLIEGIRLIANGIVLMWQGYNIIKAIYEESTAPTTV